MKIWRSLECWQRKNWICGSSVSPGNTEIGPNNDFPPFHFIASILPFCRLFSCPCNFLPPVVTLLPGFLLRIFAFT